MSSSSAESFPMFGPEAEPLFIEPFPDDNVIEGNRWAKGAVVYCEPGFEEYIDYSKPRPNSSEL